MPRRGEEDRRDGADPLPWKKKCGGLRIAQAKRLQELGKENSRRKLLLADAELDKAIFREAASGRPWAAQLNF